MLLGICRKENFLDLFENFILFDHSNGKTAKILARNHQYLGVNEAVKAYADRKLKEVAVSLLKQIKARISELDHWTDKQETKAEIDNIIRNTL